MRESRPAKLSQPPVISLKGVVKPASVFVGRGTAGRKQELKVLSILCWLWALLLYSLGTLHHGTFLALGKFELQYLRRRLSFITVLRMKPSVSARHFSK
jgi:hypothetical protein